MDIIKEIKNIISIKKKIDTKKIAKIANALSESNTTTKVLTCQTYTTMSDLYYFLYRRIIDHSKTYGYDLLFIDYYNKGNELFILEDKLKIERSNSKDIIKNADKKYREIKEHIELYSYDNQLENLYKNELKTSRDELNNLLNTLKYHKININNVDEKLKNVENEIREHFINTKYEQYNSLYFALDEISGLIYKSKRYPNKRYGITRSPSSRYNEVIYNLERIFTNDEFLELKQVTYNTFEYIYWQHKM